MGDIFLEKRDRISELPDDILLNIMSPMRMEEAAKTSLFSNRWRYLWARQTHLHFNHLVLFPEIVPDLALSFVTADQKAKYINWVNQVVDLALHCSPCIDTFKVQFMLDNNAAHHIDKWVRFATLKKVKHLELTSYNANNEPYSFGFHLLKPSLSPLVTMPSPGTAIRSWHTSTGRTEESRLVFKSIPMLVELTVGAADLTPILLRVLDLAAQLSKLTLVLWECKIPGGFLPTFTYLKQLTLKFRRCVYLDIFAITKWLESCQMVREFKLELSWDIEEIKIEPNKLKKLGLGDDNTEGGDDIEGGDNTEGDGDTEEDDDTEGDADSSEGDADFEGDDVVEGDDDFEEDDIKDYTIQRKTPPNLKVLHAARFSGCYREVEFLLDFACNLETIICDATRWIFDIRGAEFVEASRRRASKLWKILPPKICVDII